MFSPQRHTGIRPFYLHRLVDASGVSGTGIVAVGVVLPSGKAVMEWRSRWKTVTVFESVQQVVLIHGHGGRTAFCWGTPPEPEARPLPLWTRLFGHLQRMTAPPQASPPWPLALAAPPRPRSHLHDVSDRVAAAWRTRLSGLARHRAV